MISKLILVLGLFFNTNEKINADYELLSIHTSSSVVHFKNEYNVYRQENYYNNEHKKDIARKINRYLNSSLKDMGEYIVNYSLDIGLDPYLATGVILQETGCYYNCSYLSRVCNNYGGNKGKPSCNGGSYRRFSTKEEGLKFAMNTLNRYYQKGKKTAKAINPSYAADTTWYVKVNNYIKKLKKD